MRLIYLYDAVQRKQGTIFLKITCLQKRQEAGTTDMQEKFIRNIIDEDNLKIKAIKITYRKGINLLERHFINIYPDP